MCSFCECYIFCLKINVIFFVVVNIGPNVTSEMGEYQHPAVLEVIIEL